MTDIATTSTHLAPLLHALQNHLQAAGGAHLAEFPQRGEFLVPGMQLIHLVARVLRGCSHILVDGRRRYPGKATFGKFRRPQIELHAFAQLCAMIRVVMAIEEIDIDCMPQITARLEHPRTIQDGPWIGVRWNVLDHGKGKNDIEVVVRYLGRKLPHERLDQFDIRLLRGLRWAAALSFKPIDVPALILRQQLRKDARETTADLANPRATQILEMEQCK